MKFFCPTKGRSTVIYGIFFPSNEEATDDLNPLGRTLFVASWFYTDLIYYQISVELMEKEKSI